MTGLNDIFRKITAGLTGVFLLLLLGVSTTVNAQESQQSFNPWNLELRGGFGIPAGGLADNFDSGSDWGLKLAYYFSPHLSIRNDYDVEIFSGKGNVPDTRLWHYTIGMGWSVTNALTADTPWWFIMNAGLGATTISSDEVQGESFNETYFAINYGAKLGYDISENVDLFVETIGYTTFADENDTQFFADNGGETFGSVTSWPTTFGFTYRF